MQPSHGTRSPGTPRTVRFPGTPRHVPWARPVQLVLRSLHLAAMALVVGALPFGATFQDLRGPILATVLTGVLLFAVDLVRDLGILVQGSGVAVLVKLALLGLGELQPAHRLGWYLAAVLVASVGAHMPGVWRHFSFATFQVVRRPE